MHTTQTILRKTQWLILTCFVLLLNNCSNKNVLVNDTPEANVVVLLPLSGTYKQIGDAYLKSIELALFEFSDTHLKAQILDTKGTFEGTLEALKHVEQADIVLGPVMSTSVDAAAIWALKRGTPVVSLTNNSVKAQPGVFVFGLPPQSETTAMLRFAPSKNISRISAILPSGPFGTAIKETLESQASAFGVDIVDIFFYSPGLGELNTIIKRMRNKTVDGVYIPNGGEELFKIATALDKAKISGKILGSQQWNISDVKRWAILKGAWYTTAHTPQRTIFENQYTTLYNTAPEPTAYLAYDAMAMIAKLHKQRSHSPFTINALTHSTGFQGVSGVFKLTARGKVTRPISIMEILNGQTKLIGTIEEK